MSKKRHTRAQKQRRFTWRKRREVKIVKRESKQQTEVSPADSGRRPQKEQ